MAPEGNVIRFCRQSPSSDTQAYTNMTSSAEAVIDPRANAPLPVADRVAADARYTGRGIVAAFLDSGFYAHPDLTTPRSRILGYHDLVHRKSGVEHIQDDSDPSAWHG